MKRVFQSILIIFLVVSFQQSSAQTLSESAKKKVTVGVDLFTDIWNNVPSTVNDQLINQGTNVYMTYNIPVGNSKTTTFGIGLGFGTHNLSLKDGHIADIKSDTIQFVPLALGLSLKKDKLTFSYLELPMHLKFLIKKSFKFSVGLKISYLIDSKEKYVGTLIANGATRKIKNKGVYQLNTVGYSPEIRFGYKAINVFAAYQIVSIFRTGHGPGIHPFSVGITITPF